MFKHVNIIWFLPDTVDLQSVWGRIGKEGSDDNICNVDALLDNLKICFGNDKECDFHVGSMIALYVFGSNLAQLDYCLEHIYSR